MAILYFVLATSLCLFLTNRLVIYYRNKNTLSTNKEALIKATGYGMTFLTGFFAPIITRGINIPSDKNYVILFGWINALAIALVTYVGVKLKRPKN